MKKLPILYARTSNGSVQQWEMIIDDDSYYSIEGIVGGKLTRNNPTVTKGKNIGRSNETGPPAQAELEAQAKFDKKKKSGGYFENLADIDQEQYFQVMLAKSFSDYKDKIDWSKGVGVQIKYNGGRVVARKSGLFTRKGEKILSIPHIEEGLKPFFDTYPSAILDGEGFNFELRERLNEIMSLLRKTVHISKEDTDKSKELIRYYVYDGALNNDNITLKDDYLTRKQAIDIYFKDWYGKDIVHEVPTHIVYSEEELNELYGKFLEDNHEGAIIRILGQPYQEKRSKFLLKFKPTNDSEYKILAIKSGEGNWAGKAKIVTCQRIDGGKYLDDTDTFDATFKGSMEEATECLQSKDKYIGKIVTIYYNGLTGKLKPNYGQFDINNSQK